ncbi:MAG: bifunctional homocysteine S-methyltransferase/methylenetetrahydrofolate reductase [candidate division NC10 bacterium]|nr:bifunctional homocysteine S-methyltransferase/methylenetetrahydrofolate reductase [candidate division NC10 bacterium]
MSGILEALRDSVLVCDGAMGSMLYQILGHLRCTDEVNLTHPESVLKIHLEYVAAGAQIIETNTFGANRLKLATYGLADRTVEINHRAVKLAREAREIAGREVFIAGSIGPVGTLSETLEEPIRAALTEAYQEQARALEDRGVDCFIVETFPSLAELLCCLGALRGATRLPVVAQLTFTEEAKTPTGITPRAAVEALRPLGLAAFGLNCSVGPGDTLGILREMAAAAEGYPLSAQPNAGFPSRVAGRIVYPASSPEYFANFAQEAGRLGARIVGGCCGTAPAHIRAMAEAVRYLSPTRAVSVAEAPEAVEEVHAPSPELSPFGRKLKAKTFVRLVELDPPKGIVLDRVLEAAKGLKDAGCVDAVDINSGTLARIQLDSLMMATAIERRIGIETVPHLTTRDMSVMGLQSALMGAWAVGGIRNILSITGDPPAIGDYPQARGVFEIDSIGLVRLIQRLNRGLDHAGKVIGPPTAFTVGVALNPTAQDLETELRRFEQKVAAGADYAMTQPLFAPELWTDFLRLLGKPPIPILVGVWPLASYKQALRLHNEVPGIVVPDRIQDLMKQAGPEARAEGLRIARDVYAVVRETAAGVYVIPPFNRYEEALAVLEDA